MELNAGILLGHEVSVVDQFVLRQIEILFCGLRIRIQNAGECECKSYLELGRTAHRVVLIVVRSVQLLLDRLQLVRILGDPHRLVDMIQNALGQVQRPADRHQLRLVVRIHLQRDRVQALEQQRILGESLQCRGQQILELQPPAGLVRLGLGQEAMQVVVFAPLLLEGFERDLLAGAKVGGVLLQFVTGSAAEHGEEEVADGGDHGGVFVATLLELLLELAVVVLEDE